MNAGIESSRYWSTLLLQLLSPFTLKNSRWSSQAHILNFNL